VAQQDNQGRASGAPGTRGEGLTQEGATSTGVDGPVYGATILLTLYGLATVVWDLVAGESLAPDSGLAIAGIMVGLLLVGAVLGGLASGRSDR